jgi:hypothetical protein
MAMNGLDHTSHHSDKNESENITLFIWTKLVSQISHTIYFGSITNE